LVCPTFGSKRIGKLACCARTFMLKSFPAFAANAADRHTLAKLDKNMALDTFTIFMYPRLSREKALYSRAFYTTSA